MEPVYQIDLDGGIIRRFESIQSASKEVGIDAKNIRSVLKGIQKSWRLLLGLCLKIGIFKMRDRESI